MQDACRSKLFDLSFEDFVVAFEGYDLVGLGGVLSVHVGGQDAEGEKVDAHDECDCSDLSAF